MVWKRHDFCYLTRKKGYTKVIVMRMETRLKLDEATSYEQWRKEAQAADNASGAASWKIQDKTNRYDYSIIRRRRDELAAIRSDGDFDELLYYMNEGVHGNMAGMGAPSLYTRALFGTKTLITDYVDELILALEKISKAPSNKLTKADKRAYFRRASMGFGRTALMLSGAGSLGAFHLGSARAMVSEGILPRVISGASAGAFVTAFLGTRSRAERSRVLSSPDLHRYLDLNAPVNGRRQVDQYDLEELLRQTIPDLTFQEAYEESKLHINISVAPSRVQQRSRLLNAITSPNACIREAVMASCAIPGVLPAVTLAAKDSHGNRRDYIPSRTWVDGSIMDELPSKRLARLYGVNYFVSSQANPLIQGQTCTSNPLLTAASDIYQSAYKEWLKTIYPVTSGFIRNSYPLNVMARNWFSMATQEYDADINIVTESKNSRPGEFFETLTPKETRELICEGERSTWPVLERLRITTAVARCIDNILLDMGEDTLQP